MDGVALCRTAAMSEPLPNRYLWRQSCESTHQSILKHSHPVAPDSHPRERRTRTLPKSRLCC
jgi:hypothetical protein